MKAKKATAMEACTASTRALQRRRQVAPEPGRHRPEERQDQHPEQHRAFVIPPGAGDLVEHRLGGMRVLDHQPQREIRGDEGMHQRREGKGVSRNCAVAAGSATAIQPRQPLCAPMSGTTACTHATRKARIRAKCPSSVIIPDIYADMARGQRKSAAPDVHFVAGVRIADWRHSVRAGLSACVLSSSIRTAGVSSRCGISRRASISPMVRTTCGTADHGDRDDRAGTPGPWPGGARRNRSSRSPPAATTSGSGTSAMPGIRAANQTGSTIAAMNSPSVPSAIAGRGSRFSPSISRSNQPRCVRRNSCPNCCSAAF